MTASWDVTPCRLIEISFRFRGVYSILYQGGELFAYEKSSGDDRTDRTRYTRNLDPSTIGFLAFSLSSSDPHPLPIGPVKVLPCPTSSRISTRCTTSGLIIALTMEAVRASETSVYFRETTQQ
jgi:hypothetical protein